MIEIQGLTKKYGSKVIVENWSYRFEKGKIYGLIGRNGAGKTTVMKCISGLIFSDNGNIHTEQGDMTGKDYLERSILYVSDEPIYYSDLNVYEHFWMVCRLENLDKASAKREMDDLVEKFCMKEYLHYYPSALSKGTLQRMMIIMNFLRKDENILLDEPFNGLDPIQLQQTLEICKQQKEKRSMIISSHDIESLGTICDEYLLFTANGIKAYASNTDREAITRLIGESYV